MPWCHNCGSEYIDGVECCTDCGGPLTAEAPPERPDPGPVSLVYLTTVSDGYEVGMLEALLRENGIPCVRRHREAGEYMSVLMGRSVYGVDLLVSGRDYERADELLRFLRSGEFAADEEG
ncbi:MAG: DUF2007 domain-containing protein [Oscillospiraceae bacterium]|jgi:hypothetical protein|nr:DUF2007 domain-containing protein [Oscillospiraceae bacterium]